MNSVFFGKRSTPNDPRPGAQQLERVLEVFEEVM